MATKTTPAQAGSTRRSFLRGAAAFFAAAATAPKLLTGPVEKPPSWVDSDRYHQQKWPEPPVDIAKIIRNYPLIALADMHQQMEVQGLGFVYGSRFAGWVQDFLGPGPGHCVTHVGESFAVGGLVHAKREAKRLKAQYDKAVEGLS